MLQVWQRNYFWIGDLLSLHHQKAQTPPVLVESAHRMNVGKAEDSYLRVLLLVTMLPSTIVTVTGLPLTISTA